MNFQTVVASQEEARPAETGSGHRTKHSAQTNPKHQTGVLRRPSSLWQDGTRLKGRHLVTSARQPPRFFLQPCIHSAPVSGGDYVVWDGNSTPVYGACQDIIPTYCIESN